MDKQNYVINNKCRTCLNNFKGLQSLRKLAVNGGKLGDLSYAQLLQEVTDINIMDDTSEDLPQHICGCCARKLKNTHAFIRQAKDANVTLLSLLNKSSRSEEDPVPTVDCLEESQIDIQTCLEIKLESDTEDVTHNCPMEKCMVQLKDEEQDGYAQEQKRIVSEEIQKTSLNEDKLITPPAEDFGSTSSQNENEYTFSHSDTDEEFQPQNDSTKKQKGKRRRKTLTKDNVSVTKDLSIAVPCLQCNKIFKNSIVLSRHLRNTHIPEEQKCSCPVCGVKFTRACNMFKHMRTQHDPDAVKSLLPTQEKMHQCDKCPQKYTKKKHLNNHIKAKHSDAPAVSDDKSNLDNTNAKVEERSLCSFCGCSFSKKAYLIVHMRRHTGERPFKCDLCERAFSHNSELKCHRRIHTGEKPYKCKLCEKAFRVYKKLATHMRSHTDERPYKCSQCERSFKYSKDLNIHTRIHTGERPYCCSVCGSTFTQSNSLKAHRMKLGHMEDVTQHPQTELAMLHSMNVTT